MGLVEELWFLWTIMRITMYILRDNRNITREREGKRAQRIDFSHDCSRERIGYFSEGIHAKTGFACPGAST